MSTLDRVERRRLAASEIRFGALFARVRIDRYRHARRETFVAVDPAPEETLGYLTRNA